MAKENWNGENNRYGPKKDNEDPTIVGTTVENSCEAAKEALGMSEVLSLESIAKELEHRIKRIPSSNGPVYERGQLGFESGGYDIDFSKSGGNKQVLSYLSQFFAQMRDGTGNITLETPWDFEPKVYSEFGNNVQFFRVGYMDHISTQHIILAILKLLIENDPQFENVTGGEDNNIKEWATSRWLIDGLCARS